MYADTPAIGRCDVKPPYRVAPTTTEWGVRGDRS